MSTKITPSRLDSTKDFSSLVPSAFSRANAAFTQANAAFAQANTGGGSSTDVYARDTANAAFTKANTAGLTFTAANTTPSSPKLGDQWYYIATDILYEYINDGTSNNWVDIISPTMSNNSTSSGGTSVAKVVGYNLVFGG